jgi:hypothetical protein
MRKRIGAVRHRCQRRRQLLKRQLCAPRSRQACSLRMRKKPRERIKRRALVGFEVEGHSEYFVLLGAVRNIHELFQPILLGKAHGYCIIWF